MTQGKNGTARAGAVALLNAVLGEGRLMAQALDVPGFAGLGPAEKARAQRLALAVLRASGHTSVFSRINKKDRELFAEKLSALGLGLEDRMKQPVGLLSGGQRQALTLLMATLVTPKLLLLDEHTAALDPGTADKVLELTKKIVAENHLTCLMITHNMHDALTLGNRTLMMDHGHIVLDISGEERTHTTVDGLLDRFAENVGHALDNDRILLSKEK